MQNDINEYRKAITVVVITGRRIKTIPVGTIFEVLLNPTNTNIYSPCKGLPINSIYNDEFKLI